MTQATEQRDKSCVCPKCGYLKDAANEACLRCTLNAPAPKHRTQEALVVGVLLLIGVCFNLYGFLTPGTALDVAAKLLSIAVYGAFAWALLTVQPWARKWAISALVVVFCTGTFMSSTGFSQQQEAMLKTAHAAQQQTAQAVPVHGKSGTPATRNTPMRALPRPTPPVSTTTPPNSSGSAVVDASLRALLLTLFIGIIVAAVINGLSIFALSCPDMIDDLAQTLSDFQAQGKGR